jgi:hypothetical protein
MPRFQCRKKPRAETDFGQSFARDYGSRGEHLFREFATMKKTAKPVKKNRNVESGKKLERKTSLMSVRSLTVTWPQG